VGELYKPPDLVTDIKRRRLQFLEHVIGMDQTRVSKNIFESKPEGRRKLGRTILRWLELIMDDLR
jgi:hypothetical protein